MRRLSGWIVLGLVSVVGCGGGENTEPAPSVATVTVSPAMSTIAPGEVLQLQVTTRDVDGLTLTGREITWTSSNADVGIVSPTGAVTGVADGDVTITAASEGKAGSALVTVLTAVANVASVTVQPDGVVVLPGETSQLTAVTRDEADNVLTGRLVTWTTSNASVATVSAQGLVSGVSPGSAQIIANSEGAADTATVHVPIPLDLTDISAGNVRSCGVSSSGAGFCWGFNDDGQLGDGTTVSTAWPQSVGGGLTFRTIVAGGEGTHTCGITTNGSAYCWGRNNVGQLGDGTTVSTSLPVVVAGGLTFATLTVHAKHTCGLTDDGLAYCWGLNEDGELGTGDTSPSNVPVAVASAETFTSIAAGYHHTCALAVGGVAYCWGANYNGFLGNGTTEPSTVPVAVAGGHTFSLLTAGSFHACGLTTDGAAYCWGFNGLGDGTDNQSLIPVPVAGGHVFTGLSAGFANTCGLTAGGEAYCWGDNALGQVGTGTPSNAILVPTAVLGGLEFKQVRAGALHTCGLTVDDVGYCWGANGSGQLGNGTAEHSPVPVKVAGQS